MKQIPYMWVPLCSLLGCTFILLSFARVEKNSLVHDLRAILVTAILFAGGSVCLRLQIAPGLEFWLDVSILGLTSIPIAINYFIFHVCGITKSKVLVICMGITTLINGTNILNHFFIPIPEIVTDASHNVTFIYHLGRGAQFLLLFEVGMMAYAMFMAALHKDENSKKLFLPITIGIVAIITGGIFVMIPGNVFPFDTLGALVMSFCFTICLFKHEVFNIVDNAIVAITYSTAIVLVTACQYFSSREMDRYVKNHPDDSMVLIYSVYGLLFLAVAFFLYQIARLVVFNYTKRQERINNARLQRFRIDIADTLEEEELYDQIVETCEDIFQPTGLEILIKKNAMEQYEIVRKMGAAEELSQRDKEENGFDNISGYGRGVGLIHYDNQNWGCILIRLGRFSSAIDGRMTEILDDICAYASASMKNARVYQKAFRASITDDLTGLYNRKHAINYLHVGEWNREHVNTMIFMDMDDFKLYNELYGSLFADRLLCWCGNRIKTLVDEKGIAFRYGSNEFLLVLWDYNVENAVKLARDMCDDFLKESEGRPKVIQRVTFSVGVASFPESADTPEELLKKAERAAFFAKRNGKNRIEIYNNRVNWDMKIVDKHSYDQIAPTIYALTAAIDAKDNYTFQHSNNVSEYASILAQQIGLNSEEVRIIREAGLLHDIGKIGIPENILKKTGKLTEEEYNVMKQHVENSIEMIHYLPNMNYVIPAVVGHHERYDGKGYPRGIAGEDIPLLARCLSLADGYDAMISERPYKKPFTKEYAIEEIRRNSGTQFDPKLSEVFINLIKEGKI